MAKKTDQFYCSECNEWTKSCLKGRSVCAASAKHLTERIRKDQEQREKDGKMTVGDCISLHGRLATLIILGEKEMAEKLRTIEPIVDDYRDQWDAKGWTEREIQEWKNTLSVEEQESLQSMFDFYIKEVGAFLSDKVDELI